MSMSLSSALAFLHCHLISGTCDNGRRQRIIEGDAAYVIVWKSDLYLIKIFEFGNFGFCLLAFLFYIKIKYSIRPFSYAGILCQSQSWQDIGHQ